MISNIWPIRVCYFLFSFLYLSKLIIYIIDSTKVNFNKNCSPDPTQPFIFLLYLSHANLRQKSIICYYLFNVLLLLLFLLLFKYFFILKVSSDLYVIRSDGLILLLNLVLFSRGLFSNDLYIYVNHYISQN